MPIVLSMPVKFKYFSIFWQPSKKTNLKQCKKDSLFQLA